MTRYFIAFLVMGLLLTACQVPILNQTAKDESIPESNTTVQEVTVASDQMTAAFASGEPLKCMATQPDAPASQYLIKNKKTKITTQPTLNTEDQFFMINDGTTMYSWTNDQSKMGTKIDLAAMEQFRNNEQNTFDNMYQEFPDVRDPKERQKIMDSGFSIQCEPAEIGDEEFVPPADIQFRDLLDTFQQFGEQTATP